MPLINFEVNLILIWSENCVLTDITTQAAVPVQGNNPPRQAINAPTGASFKIKETKLHVPVVSLSIPDDNKLFQQLPSVEIKDFDLLIDDKSFFHTPIKNKEETYEKIIGMSRNNDYTTGNLSDYNGYNMMEQLCSLSWKNQKKQLLNFHKVQ